jgi:hypothetical protein
LEDTLEGYEKEGEGGLVSTVVAWDNSPFFSASSLTLPIFFYRERVVFFSGSFFFSARPIPGLEADTLPKHILDGSGSDGDSFTVHKVWHYTTPKVLLEPVVAPAGTMTVDHRCNDCTKAFPDIRGILQHCQETGHKPVFDPVEQGAQQAESAVFLSYVNMVLSRALGERFAKVSRASLIRRGRLPLLSFSSNN